ncbi:MAG: SDR family oxidoreductase [Candidatus Nanopelagicales bacterium]|nr:SDR family oxidoreductase [Candidatus Nanopelagicales bacterium]
MAIALVTGPTAGIGRAFSVALARAGFDLVLVARDETRLTQLAEWLTSEFGVHAEVLVADLADGPQLVKVEERLGRADHPISVLVNNAGLGVKASFAQSDIGDEQQMLDVLVGSVLRTTHAAVPGMVHRGFGVIINVSSIASWITGGTYSAAKAWVTVFSESLAQELAGTGVRVTAVCPGFVHTEFHDRAGMDMSNIPDWMWLEAEQVVEQAMRDVSRNRPISVAGAQYKALSILVRYAPRPLVRFATATGRVSGRFGRR